MSSPLREVVIEQPTPADRFTYERDGLTLAYSVVGDGQQPIVFIHGATATGEFEWGALAAALGPGYRCILPTSVVTADLGWRVHLTRVNKSAPTCNTSSAICNWVAPTLWASRTARRSR